jgi:hypothetical protein
MEKVYWNTAVTLVAWLQNKPASLGSCYMLMLHMHSLVGVGEGVN